MTVQAKSSVDPSQTSTGSENVEEISSPISRQPRSTSEVCGDENALRLIPPSPLSFLSMVPLQTVSNGGDVEITEPRSQKVLFRGRGPAVIVLPPIREDSSELSQGTTPENTDHVGITIPDMCRTCGPDEDSDEDSDSDEERDNRLVKLGCRCKGSLSKMHRKCILRWFGPRIVMRNNYSCELCSGRLNERIVRIVLRASIGRDSGRDILVYAMAISRISVRVPARLPRRLHGRLASPDLNNNETGPQTNIDVEGARSLPQPVVSPRRRRSDNRVSNAVFKIISLLAFAITFGTLIFVLWYKKR